MPTGRIVVVDETPGITSPYFSSVHIAGSISEKKKKKKDI